MTSFLFFSTLLAALSIALLLRRGRRPAAAGASTEELVAVTRPTRGLALALAAGIVVIAIGGYAWVGSPSLIAVSPDTLDANATGPESAAANQAIATALGERAGKHPDDAMAWYQLARSELSLGHLPEAAQAYRRALALRPKDPDLLADGADVLAVAAGGNLEGEPIHLVERALAVDPGHLKALALKGSYLVTRGDFAGAVAAWEHALQVAGPNDPIAGFIGHQIQAVRAMASGQLPAATAGLGPRVGASAPAPRAEGR
jgi:cytochrome c-type biogenesis protein CcmH